MFSFLKNLFKRKYVGHDEAIIISCFFNPENSPYRLKAFNTFYDSIKHLNHKIVECIIGDSKPQLPENPNIQRLYTENLLWHKEALLNHVTNGLTRKFKYIFWIDADVLFTNKNWMVDAVNELKQHNIVQLFEYCVHLNKDELKPSFDLTPEKPKSTTFQRHPQVWRSFAANYVTTNFSDCTDYNKHGHVGFAWGAKREVLDKIELYDKALIGGADHIIAHAAAGHIPHQCITNAFNENIDDVLNWSRRFFDVTKGNLSYVKGDLYHLWHGDIDRRRYLQRIKDFTPKTKQITQLGQKDKNGLYITKSGDDKYIKAYFKHREVQSDGKHVSGDDGFMASMMLGYMTDNPLLAGMVGKNWGGALLGSAMSPHHNQQGNVGSVSSIPSQVMPNPISSNSNVNEPVISNSSNFS